MVYINPALKKLAGYLLSDEDTGIWTAFTKLYFARLIREVKTEETKAYIRRHIG